MGAVQRYASGVPLGLPGAFGLIAMGHRPYITLYEDWRAPMTAKKSDPAIDRYYRQATTASRNGDVPTITQQGWFPLQPRDGVGNMTRVNPKARNFPIYNEDVSLAKTFTISHERRQTAGLRLGAFNVLNRTISARRTRT